MRGEEFSIKRRGATTEMDVGKILAEQAEKMKQLRDKLLGRKKEEKVEEKEEEPKKEPKPKKKPKKAPQKTTKKPAKRK